MSTYIAKKYPPVESAIKMPSTVKVNTRMRDKKKAVKFRVTVYIRNI